VQDEEDEIYVIPFPDSDPQPSPSKVALVDVPRPYSPPPHPNAGFRSDYDPSTSSTTSSSHAEAPGATQTDSPNSVSIPRIVITLAPPCQEHLASSRVPVQDAAFGGRLTVPSHAYAALNASHPPLLSSTLSNAAPLHVSAVRAWTYRWGHWCAVAHALDEQERRGLFSRPFVARRRGIRKRGGKKREHTTFPPNASISSHHIKN
jgi:hypothetical protein